MVQELVLETLENAVWQCHISSDFVHWISGDICGLRPACAQSEGGDYDIGEIPAR